MPKIMMVVREDKFMELPIHQQQLLNDHARIEYPGGGLLGIVIEVELLKKLEVAWDVIGMYGIPDNIAMLH